MRAACYDRRSTKIIAYSVSNRTLLMLAMGDPATNRRARNFRRFFEEHGWKVEALSVPVIVQSGPRRFLEYHRRLRRVVRSKSASVVMACDLYSLFAAVWMKRHGRAEWVLYDSREVYTELPRVAHRPVVKFVWRTFERRGLLRSDLIIVTGPRDTQAICDVHQFLPRPVLVRNLPLLADASERDRSALDLLGIPNSSRVAVYVGGLQSGRGLKSLIGAFSEMPGDHLLMIGDGALKSALEAHAPPNVHFAGAIESESAMKIVAACDVGIALVEPLSKSYELALPSKLFEYMMCGIPVVSSRLVQVLELFRDEDWITLVDEGSSESIRVGIESAFSRALIPALRERERSLAQSEYHFGHEATKLLLLLDRLAN